MSYGHLPEVSLKIAYITPEVHKRWGVPHCTAVLVERFCGEHEVSAFCNEIEDIYKQKITFHRVLATGGSRFARHVTFLVLNTIIFVILSLLKKNDFDIIHTTGSDSIFANVVTSHFCVKEGLRFDETGRGNLPKGGILRKLRDLDNYLHDYFCCFGEKLVFGRKNSRLRIVVSERMKRDFVRHYGSAAEDIIVIPNGVDCQRFTPHNKVLYRDSIRKEHSISSEDLMLLFVGHFWERKGLPQLIEAVSLIPRQDVKLVILGRGDASLYKDIARNKAVDERVVFVEQSSTIWEYYGAADIFVLPTLYEPFGLVITEAMASGLPVITSRIAGAADLIDDGVSGLLLDDPTDDNELAAKIDLLLSDAELRSDMGKKARLAAERASWDEIAKRTLEVYNTVVNSKKKGRI